ETRALVTINAVLSTDSDTADSAYKSQRSCRLKHGTLESQHLRRCGRADGSVQLIVFSLPKLRDVKRHVDIGRDTGAFHDRSSPRVRRGGGEAKDDPVPDREIRPAEDLATRRRADQRCQTILLRKGSNHLAGAQRVLVQEHDDASMERLRLQTLGR